MSTQWNSNYPNRFFSNEHSRPYVISPMVLACRICDKVFLSSHSLIEHYESHQNEYARRTQNNQTATLVARLRESRERNITNNPFQSCLSPPSTFQPRHHPYLPNGFRTLQRAETPLAQSRPFLPSTQTQNLLQPRHPVANHVTLGDSFPFPNSTSGQSGAGCSQFVHHQRPSPANKVSPLQQVPSPDIGGQNRDHQLAENGAVWYLSQLEKPIPKVIDILHANNQTRSLSYG